MWKVTWSILVAHGSSEGVYICCKAWVWEATGLALKLDPASLNLKDTYLEMVGTALPCVATSLISCKWPLTHWPLGDFDKEKNNFQAKFSDWWLRFLLWNCPQMNITGPRSLMINQVMAWCYEECIYLSKPSLFRFQCWSPVYNSLFSAVHIH